MRDTVGNNGFISEQRRRLSPVRGGLLLLAVGIGALIFSLSSTLSARAETQALADIVAKKAPADLSEAERLIALVRFVHEDIRQVAARYG